MVEQAVAHINPDGWGRGDSGRQDRQGPCFCRAHPAAGDTNTSMKLQEQRLTQGKQEDCLHSPEEVLFRWGTGGGQGWRGEAGRVSEASPKQQEVWLRGDLEGGRGGQGLRLGRG